MTSRYALTVALQDEATLKSIETMIRAKCQEIVSEIRRLSLPLDNQEVRNLIVRDAISTFDPDDASVNALLVAKHLANDRVNELRDELQAAE